MEDIDLAFWGMVVVPIGLIICFGPALLIWMREEHRAGKEAKQIQDQNL